MTIETARNLYPLWRAHMPELREWHRLNILDPGMYPTYRNELLDNIAEARRLLK
jgi:hypothetical protein